MTPYTIHSPETDLLQSTELRIATRWSSWVSFVISFVVVSIALGPLGAANKQDFAYYVVPKGDDANSGSSSNPFRTLFRARREVRTIKNP